MIRPATLEVELARLDYEDLLDAIERDAASDAQLEELRERVAMLGADAFECVTGERLTLFVGDNYADSDWLGTSELGYPPEWYVPFYSVAVIVRPDETPLMIHGAFAEPLASDVACAYAYLRSIGLPAEHLRVLESTELLWVLEVS